MKQTYYLLLAASMLALGACSSDKDIYDPHYNPELGVTVPEGFEWSTTQTLNVNVEVDDQYSGKYYYAVRVYDKAPAEGVLPVSAAGDVTGDMPFSRTIVVPSAATKLYIAQVFKNANGSEVVTMKEVAIDGPAVNCSFKGSSKSRAVSRAEEDNVNRISVTDGGQIESGGFYVIEKGQTVVVKKAESIENVNIKICGEGELVFEGSNLGLKNWYIHVANDADYMGKLTANKGLALQAGTILLNEGEVYIQGKDFHVNQDAKLINKGCIIVEGTAHIGEDIELAERSYMYSKILSKTGNGSSGVSVYMGTSAILKTEEMQMSASDKIGFGSYAGFTQPTESDYVQDLKVDENPVAALVQVTAWQNDGSANITTTDGILVVAPEPKKGNGNLHNRIDASEEELKAITDKMPVVTCSGIHSPIEPASPGEYTYMIEDQYPNEGDYDMNDIVVSLKYTLVPNTAVPTGYNLLVEGALRAAGANYELVPYLDIPGHNLTERVPLIYEDEVPGVAAKAGEKKAASAYFALTGGNTGAPSPVNTERGQARTAPVRFTRTFENVPADLHANDIHFSVDVNGGDANGGHTIDYKTNTLAGNESKVWHIRVTGGDVQIPYEKVNIKDAYPEFTKWFTDTHSDWYDHPTEDNVLPLQNLEEDLFR